MEAGIERFISVAAAAILQYSQNEAAFDRDLADGFTLFAYVEALTIEAPD